MEQFIPQFVIISVRHFTLSFEGLCRYVPCEFRLAPFIPTFNTQVAKQNLIDNREMLFCISNGLAGFTTTYTCRHNVVLKIPQT